MPLSKKSILHNFKYVVISHGNNGAIYIKDDEELKMNIENGSIAGGDVVVTLTEENTRVAEQKHYISL